MAAVDNHTWEAEHRGESSNLHPRLYEPLNYFTDISGFDQPGVPEDWEPDGLFEVSEYDPTQELVKGLVFESKKDVQNAVRKYNMKHNRVHTVRNTTTKRFEAFCKNREEQGCPWMMSASLQRHGNWQIVTMGAPHSCVEMVQTEGHRQLDAGLIATEILPLVKTDPALKVIIIVALIKQKYSFDISYYKGWYAKQKSIAAIFGDWDESYNLLPRFLKAIAKYNEGTVIKYQTRPSNNSNVVVFDRVFWAFKPCIAGWIYCRPVISIDATFLYGKYKGNLLIAMGKDANKQVFPLAFAIVEKEDLRNWGWFLRHLREHVAGNRLDICLISDRHAGIRAAVEREANGWGNRYRVQWRFCLRHVRSNFNKRFNDKDLKALMWKAGSQTEPRYFDHYMDQIKLLNIEAYNYLAEIPPEQWTLVYDGGFRFGERTTNISECFNGVLKSGRYLPITACAQVIFFRTLKYFDSRRAKAQEALGARQYFPPKVQAAINKLQDHAKSRHVVSFNRSTYEACVYTGASENGDSVNLTTQSCSCGAWKAYQFPCVHAFALFKRYNLDIRRYICNWFTTITWEKVWITDFHPLLHEHYWDPWDGPIWIPDAEMARGVGRPVSTRMHMEMDDDRARGKGTNLCSNCRLPGHNKTTCPNRTSHGASSSREH